MFKYFFKRKNIYLWKLYSQELAEEDCVIVLVGNKIDLCNDDEQRPVKYKDGAKLADVNLIDFLFLRNVFLFMYRNITAYFLKVVLD